MHYFTACISPEQGLVIDGGANRSNQGQPFPVVSEEKHKNLTGSPPPPSRAGTGLPKSKNGLATPFSGAQFSIAQHPQPPTYRSFHEQVAPQAGLDDTEEHPLGSSFLVQDDGRGRHQAANRQTSAAYRSVERYKRPEEVTASKGSRLRSFHSVDRSIFGDNDPLRASFTQGQRIQAFSGANHRDIGSSGIRGDPHRMLSGHQGSLHSVDQASGISHNSNLTNEQLSIVASVVASESVASKKASTQPSFNRSSSNTSMHTPFQSSGANSFHGLSFQKKGVINISEACRVTTKKYRDEIASIDNVISQVDEQIVTFNISIADLKRKIVVLKEKRQLYEDILPIMSHRIKEIERIKAALFVQRSQSREGVWGGFNLFGPSSTPEEDYIFEDPEIIAMRTAFRLTELGVFNPAANPYSQRSVHLTNQIHVTPINTAYNEADSEMVTLVQRIKSLKDRLERG